MPTEIEILNSLINIKGYVVESDKTEFDIAATTVKFVMSPLHNGICGCSEKECSKVKDQHIRKYRDLEFGTWTAVIWIYKRRLKCPRCGIRSERIDFADERATCTRRLEVSVFKDTINKPIASTAQRWQLSWDAVLNIEKKYLEKWQEYKGPLKDVKWLGIDEVVFGSKDNLYTVISDLQRGEVLALVSGNSQGSIDAFFNQAGKAFCSNIEAVCVDMWKAFSTSVSNYCPNAKIVYDKFHIMRHLNNAIDEVRRQEFFRNGDENRELMRGKRWLLLLRRWYNLTMSQKHLLKDVFALNQRIAKAHYLKEIFGDLWCYTNRKWATKFLERWRKELRWQRLKPLEKFYTMVEKHINGILNYCEVKLPLGLVENINGRIKSLICRTRGFRDEKHFALRIMFMTDSTPCNFLSTIHT